jgi:hypothetical protein
VGWRDEIAKMLAIEAPGSTIEITDGNHLRIMLPNGAPVYCANTPSDSRRSLLNVRSTVRRALRAGGS